jgi:hypothetical protein
LYGNTFKPFLYLKELKGTTKQRKIHFHAFSLYINYYTPNTVRTAVLRIKMYNLLLQLKFSMNGFSHIEFKHKMMKGNKNKSFCDSVHVIVLNVLK